LIVARWDPSDTHPVKDEVEPAMLIAYGDVNPVEIIPVATFLGDARDRVSRILDDAETRFFP
jgi:helix-turn-helix protein